jgi:hypothetical protein
METVTHVQKIMQLLQEAAQKAADKNVEVRLEYEEFSIEGRVKATITTTPRKEDNRL